MSSSVTAANPLTNLHGTIALAGAGKMGGAMLTGWLAGGLDANRVVVVEPLPVRPRSAHSPPMAFASIRRTPARPIRWWSR